MGLMVDGIGQQPALVKTHVTRGRPDQPGYRMPFHVFGHVETHQLDAHRQRQLSRDLGLADARGPAEQVRSDRLFRLAQTRPGQLDGAGKRVDGLVLAEDHGLEVALEGFQRLAVVHRYAFRGDAGDLGDDGLDVLHRNRLAPPFLRNKHPRRTDFVNYVQRLVRQLAVVDVAGRQFHGRTKRFGGVADPMVFFEIGLEPAQNLDRVLDTGLIDVDLLEPPRQSPVLLEITSVFLIGGRAHATQVAAGQGGLEDVRRIHGTARSGAGADDGVNLIDEQDRPFGIF